MTPWEPVTGNSNQDEDAPSEPGPAAAAAGLPWQRLVSSGNLEYDRILFFSDAIFAIAITLLVVDIRVPSPASGTIHAARQLQLAWPQMLGFAISFVVIGRFWVGHHTMFRHIRAFDRTMIWLNLLFLGTIAFLPYPTSLLSVTTADTASVAFYAAWVGGAGLAEAAIWIHACRVPGLVSAEITPQLRWHYALRMLVASAVFLLSIPVAFVAPSATPFTWILIGVLGYILRRRMPLADDGSDRAPV